MEKGFFKGVITGAIAAVFIGAVVIGIGDAVSGSYKSNTVVDKEFEDKVNNLTSYIDTFYLDADKVKKEDLQNGMYKGLMNSIDDKYAQYYTPDEYNDFQETNNGQYGGIGAYVSQNSDTGDIVIVNPFDGAPAKEAGIKPGDIIVDIDGTSVVGMELSDAVTLMKGEPDTDVSVKVLRDGEYIDVNITRKVVDVPTVKHEIIENGDIGYIYVSGFDKVTSTQFRQALDDIEAKNAKALIVDIRDNGGGMLDVVVDMLDRLLPEGLLVYTETNQGRDEEYYSTNEESYDKPMAVLINGYSASASEVFAGAVQDYKAGTIIGTTSYGKGIVQSIFSLNKDGDGSAIKLTTARYYTPNGRNIHGIGITPDITVEYNEELVEERDGLYYDNQMLMAISVLKNEIK
ncbi:MAG: S41 family peptidase [Lachnospiraceae bacterium]